MKRLLVGLLLGAAAALAVTGLDSAPDADAVIAGDVEGVYLLKVKGDGWVRTRDGGRVDYRARRVRGKAYLILSTTEIDRASNKMRVEIRLDPGLEGSVLDQGTGTPDFEGVGILVGDSLTVIDEGNLAYVNALTLQFQKRGRKVTGFWLASAPALSTDASFSSGVGVTLKGRLIRVKRGQPEPTLPPLDAVDTGSTR